MLDLLETELSTIANQVDAALQNGFRRLRFPATLEAIFERETSAARVRHMLIAGLIGILTYELYLFSDYTMAQGMMGTALVIRLGIFTPATLLIMLAQHRGLSLRLRESSEALLSVIGGADLVFLLAHFQETHATNYIYGLILVVMFGNIVLQLHFWYGATASLIILVIYSVATFSQFAVQPVIQFNNFLILFSTAALTLFGNYNIETVAAFTHRELRSIETAWRQ
jgi:hypothetical protein